MGSWPESLKLFGLLYVELIALFLAISFSLDIIQRRWLGPERIQRLLGGRGTLYGLLKGGLLGVITPFCSASGVPLLISMVRAGVPFRTAMAFLISSPLFDAFTLGLIGVLFGWKIVLGYTLVVFPFTLLIAGLLDRIGMARFVKASATRHSVTVPEPVAAGSRPTAPDQHHRVPDTASASASPLGDAPWEGWRTESRRSWQEAVKMFRSVLLRMTIGIVLGAVLYAVVPPGAFSDVIGGAAVLAVPIAAVIGVPFYIREEMALPIGYALVQAGVGVGPVFALMVGAAGASIPELAMLSSIFRKQLLGALVTAVFIVALAGGWLIPLFA